MQRNADAIVIGAGVIGAATCLELSRQGRKVICVDARSGVGTGSTSASAAIIRFHYSTWNSVLTAWEAAGLWDRLDELLQPAAGEPFVKFVRTGCLVLDSPDLDSSASVALLQRAGVEVEVLSADELAARFPALDNGDYYPPKRLDDPAFGDDAPRRVGAFYTPEAGFIDDPMLAAVNFMDAARRLGTEVVLNARVVEVRRSDDRVIGVTLANGDRIDAPVVINVGGPASPELNAMAGVLDEMAIRNRPLRQEMYHLHAPGDFDLAHGNATIVTDLNVGTYLRPHLGGALMAGSTEPACDPLHWVDDAWNFDEIVHVDSFETTAMRAARRLPSLGIPNRPAGIGALYDVTDDWVPIYDRSSLQGWFMACGTSGNQFKNAPLAGRFMAALVEATERGVDHDHDPVRVLGERTGQYIDLGAFSRRREKASTTGTVLG